MQTIRKIHKNTIKKLSFNIEKNKINIDFLKEKKIIDNNYYNLKKYKQTVLLDKVSVEVADSDGFHLVQEFYNMPSWAIPYVNIILRGESESGNSFEGFTDFENTDKLFSSYFNYHWQPISSHDSDEIDHYNLYIDAYASLTEKETTQTGYSYIEKPFFLTIYIIYINDKKYYEIQKSKK